MHEATHKVVEVREDLVEPHEEVAGAAVRVGLRSGDLAGRGFGPGDGLDRRPVPARGREGISL